MKILVTNDDGILAEGLWILAKALKSVGQVVVVAPDREQSAIGTAVTLTQPLRVQKIRPLVPGVEAYAVQGTPGDSVILALENLVKGPVDLVVSGINQGLNLGNDVLISGTVGAALQGYLRGFPAIALSLSGTESAYVESAARVGALLAKKVGAYGNTPLRAPILLNVNLPDRQLSDIKGIRITHLASESHIDTVEEGHDGKRKYYWLVRQRKPDRVYPDMTDIWAVEQGYVSLTPLHPFDKLRTGIYQGNGSSMVADGFCTDGLCTDLSKELSNGGS
jgi:5'-nucleotidase